MPIRVRYTAHVLWFSAEASLTKDMAEQIWFLVYMPTIVRYTVHLLWFSAEASMTKDTRDQIWFLVYMPIRVRYYSLCPLVQC
jgi:hypothetical protein